MKKYFVGRSFLASALALAMLLAPAAPAFALGELPPPPAAPTDTTPPAISGVAMTTVLPTGATIAWITSELAVSTFQYGTTQSYGSSVPLSASAAIGGTAVLTGLAPSTTYYYCIHATDLAGNAASSCGNSFATAAAPDVTAPVVSLTVAVATTTSATIAWTTSEPADAQIEYGTTASYGSTSSLSSALALTRSVELDGLSPNTAYHYRVLSRDAAGNLATGSENSFSTSALPSVSVSPSVTDSVPPVITDISSVSLESHTAAIAWITDELAVSSLEYGLTTSYGSSATLSATALLAHAAALTGLQANTTYYYCIHATDLAGNITNSCGHSFVTAAAETMLDANPPTISLVTVAPITTTSATVGWTTDEVAGGYVEYGTTDGYGSETAFNTNLALTHQAPLAGLSPSTEYHYRVHSRDEAGNAIATPDETFTTESLPVISAPADTAPPSISAVGTGIVASSVATITWTTSELAVSSVEYGTSPAYGSSAEVSASALLAHEASFVSLSPGTTYYYCIHATDLAGNAASSCGHSFVTSPLPIVTDTTAPAASLVIVSSITSDSASIHWTSTESADSQVEYGTSTSYGSETQIAPEAGLSGSALLAGLSPSTTYHFRIRSYDSSGNVGLSADYSFITGSAPVSGSGISVTSGTSASAAPIISGVGASSIGETGATISWMTDVPSDSLVEYGNSENLGSSASSVTLTTSHSVFLSGLATDTNYQFRVVSKPIGGVAFQTTSSMHDFTTLAVPVIIDPPANITSVSSSVSGSGASVSFATDEITTAQIEYGTDTSYGSVVLGSSSQQSGTLPIAGLQPGTYHFRVKAVDAGDNITYSEDHSFVIAGIASSPAPAASLVVSAPAGGAAQSSGGGGSGGSGGSGSAGAASAPVPVPNLVTAEGADSQIEFSWNNPETSGFAGTVIVRKAGSYPESPTDGQTIYNGPRETFTDTALANGTTYYYSIYSYGSAGQYSNPIRVSTAPKAGVTEIRIDRNAAEENALPAEHFTEELKRGDTSLEVEHLQQVLNVVNVHPSRLTTGYFGPLTESALKQFQATYSLPQTGVADAATRARLDAISDGWMIQGAPGDVALLQADLKRGDQGEDVGNLQEFLAFEGSYSPAIISQYFGSLTHGGVSAFQQRYGVTPVSGYVGYKTRHTMQTILGL